MQRVVARVIEAGQWATTHAAEAVHFIGIETSTADAWVRYGHGNDVHASLHVDLAERSIEALADLKDFLVRQGFVRDFDVRDWIAPEPFGRAIAQTTRRVA